MSRGAEFGELQPLTGKGAILPVLPSIVLPAASFGAGAAINTAVVTQVTPSNSFRLGQQIIFWLGVEPGKGGPDWASRVRLKLWWARPNKEHRMAGYPQWEKIDTATFGDGPVLLDPLANNRYAWVPSEKRLDVTPFSTPPPVIPTLTNSDSVLLDDCLVMDLPDPNDPTYTALFPSPQVVSRWGVFMYPAMGYALGMTWDAESGDPQGSIPTNLTISLTFAVGTLGGTNYQESVG